MFTTSYIILVEDSKAYRWWCYRFLEKKLSSGLVKKAAALYSVEKDPDLSYVDHHWRARTLVSYGDHCSLDPYFWEGIISSLLHA